MSRSVLKFLLLLVLVSSVPLLAQTGFTGYYDPSHWTLSGNANFVAGTLVLGQGGSASIVLPTTGTVSFSYTTRDASGSVTFTADEEGSGASMGKNGRTITITDATLAEWSTGGVRGGTWTISNFNGPTTPWDPGMALPIGAAVCVGLPRLRSRLRRVRA